MALFCDIPQVSIKNELTAQTINRKVSVINNVLSSYYWFYDSWGKG